MAAPAEEPKQGPPAYMVSFGDMMTLILTFFILLVSMSKEQQEGLIAKGVGSFVVALNSHGLNGVLSGTEQRQIFNEVRQRFGLPPEDDPDQQVPYDMTSAKELLRLEASRALEPRDELVQPVLAAFEPGSAALTAGGRRYLDSLAPTLRPLKGQLLVLEGHAADSGGLDPTADRELAYARARTVKEYLLESHGYADERVEARAWLMEVSGASDPSTRAVDGRLVTLDPLR